MTEKVTKRSLINVETVTEILQRMAATNLGLEEACKYYGFNMVDVNLFLINQEDGARLYYDFKKKQSMAMQESIEREAQNVPTYIDKNGVQRVDAGMIALANLKIKVQTWTLERSRPSFYNIRVQEEEKKNTNQDLPPELKAQYEALKEKYKMHY